MIKKKRLTVTCDIQTLKEFIKILDKEGIKTSFAINFLIEEFIQLYKEYEEEDN